LTPTGVFSGSPLYMSPEQILSFKNVSSSCDVYSMGVTLYYLISGKLPFDFPSPYEVEMYARQRDINGVSVDTVLSLMGFSNSPQNIFRMIFCKH